MPAVALGCVLLAAVLHALWNLAAKRAAAARHFVLLYSIASLVIWAPAVAWSIASLGPPRGLMAWISLGATGILHLGYALALQAGYRASDLSVVYPIARGFGPLVSFAGAALLLGEHPTSLSVAGLALILVGMVLVSGLLDRARRIDRTGIAWGLTTGLLIAAYTVNDGWAVKMLGISPLVVDYAGNLVRLGALAPRAFAVRRDVLADARRHGGAALVVGTLGPLAYVLVLYAMRLAPVSHVAPARELATLLGTYLGARVLREAVTPAHLFGALSIVGGVACLAFARA